METKKVGDKIYEVHSTEDCIPIRCRKCAFDKNDKLCGLAQCVDPRVYYTLIKNENIMKFKIGDKVRIISNTTNHQFQIGEEVKIVGISMNGYRAKNCKDWWMVNENDVESINKNVMKKGDRVRIIGNSNGHEFKIGEIVTITESIPRASGSYNATNGRETWYVKPSDVEPEEGQDKIIINIPEGKIAEQTQGCGNSIVITFKDKKKTLQDILDDYLKKHPYTNRVTDKVIHAQGIYIRVPLPHCNYDWTFDTWKWSEKFCKDNRKGCDYPYPEHREDFDYRYVYINCSSLIK